jgi:hypothetical protein
MNILGHFAPLASTTLLTPSTHRHHGLYEPETPPNRRGTMDPTGPKPAGTSTLHLVFGL